MGVGNALYHQHAYDNPLTTTIFQYKNEKSNIPDHQINNKNPFRYVQRESCGQI